MAPKLPFLYSPEEDVWQALWRCALAEFFGTLIFVFIGTGSVVAAQESLGKINIELPALTLIALSHGFTIVVVIYAIGDISGGHINPAVTWATWITRKQSGFRSIIYFFSQLLGAICGSAILASLIPSKIQRSLGCHGISDDLTPGQGLGFEIVMTFIFIFVVFATAISPFVGKLAPLSGEQYGPGKLTPLAIGLCILVLHTIGIPFTGASMNPARSFGPAVVHSCWDNHWIYWIGPLIGSSIAAVVAQNLFLSHPDTLLAVLSLNRGEVAAQAAETAPKRNPYSQVQEETELAVH